MLFLTALNLTSHSGKTFEWRIGTYRKTNRSSIQQVLAKMPKSAKTTANQQSEIIPRKSQQVLSMLWKFHHGFSAVHLFIALYGNAWYDGFGSGERNRKIKIRTAQIFHLLLAVISNRQNRRKALKLLDLLRNQNHSKLSSFIRCYPWPRELIRAKSRENPMGETQLFDKRLTVMC